MPGEGKNFSTKETKRSENRMWFTDTERMPYD